ncbi:hypothetical protein [Streptomyces californicus]|uniref:hypothetical protein n=1 Tax=Streptomyces californicus TaxID=67351 RepID=UPI0036A89CBE
MALASEEPHVKLWCSKDALVRMAPPPTGYDSPGEQLWMLTFAAPSDSLIKRYASRFGLEISTEAESAPAELPYEPPPFRTPLITPEQNEIAYLWLISAFIEEAESAATGVRPGPFGPGQYLG